MKYFTEDLWFGFNNIDDDSYEKSNILFKKNLVEYNKYFSTIDSHFSKKFLNTYYKYSCFHDMYFKQISYFMDKNYKAKIIFILENSNALLKIEFIDVQQYKFNVIDKQYCICGKLAWGYNEFELLENGNLKINILCDIVNEIEIVFKKIRVQKLSEYTVIE